MDDATHRAALIDTALNLVRAHLDRTTPRRVLDAGCGRGALFERVRAMDLPWDLVGLEADAEALSVAASQGVPVVAGTAEALPFEDESFDLVVIRHVLHHLAQPERAIAEAARVARQGVLLAEPHFAENVREQDASLVLELWSRRVEWQVGRRHDLPHPEESLRAMLPDELRVVGVTRMMSEAPRDGLAFAAEFLPLLGADDGPIAEGLRRDLDQILAAGETMTRPGTYALLAIR